MKLRFNRVQLYLCGICIILFYLLLNRLTLVANSSFVKGWVVNEIKWGNGTMGETEGFFTAPVVQFVQHDKVITFQGETNTSYHKGQSVTIIYQKEDVTSAKIYSFTGFWLAPLLYSLLPFLLLTALVFSFFKPDAMIVADMRNLIKPSKKSDSRLPTPKPPAP
jgi:hypothetical protein